MPNSQQHKDKALHNRAFLNSIDVNKYPDWAAVAAFYTAVHLVERLRTRLPNPSQQHSTDHIDRLQFVQSSHRPIHTDYHQLFNAALIARYQTVYSFNTQFKPADVQSVLINQYLVNIEKYVTSVFSPPAPPSPGTVGIAGS